MSGFEVGYAVENHTGAQGPRPPWWRPVRRRAWDREAALDPDVLVTCVDIDGDAHFALPTPTMEGQRKRITCVGVRAGATGTVHLPSGRAFAFNHVGQSIELVAVSDGWWKLIRAMRVGSVEP